MDTRENIAIEEVAPDDRAMIQPERTVQLYAA